MARRAWLMGVALVLVVTATGCWPFSGPTQRVPVGTRPASAPVEDASVRRQMWAHAVKVWPKVKAGLPKDISYPMAAALAAKSRMGTPTIVWEYRAGIPATASPWLGLVPWGDRTVYEIPVIVDGRTVGSLRTHDYGGTWKVWPDRDRWSAAASALTRIETAFGSSDYEWCFVENGGLWVLARRNDRVIGVLIDPILDLRASPPPVGLVEGQALRWNLDHSMGGQ